MIATMTNYEQFGEVIRKRRKALGLSQDDLAEKTYQSKSYISLLENAKGHPQTGVPVRPKEEVVAKLSEALDLPLASLRSLIGYNPELDSLETSEFLADNKLFDKTENAQRRVIAERIRYRREYLGFSQEDIASAVGLKRTTYAHYESGLNGVSSEILTKLARVLGCSADYLLGLDTETYDPDHTDLPPEFERIWGLHGKVIRAMPPGRARNAYMERLRSDAEFNLAILEGRLETEEKGKE